MRSVLKATQHDEGSDDEDEAGSPPWQRHTLQGESSHFTKPRRFASRARRFAGTSPSNHQGYPHAEQQTLLNTRRDDKHFYMLWLHNSFLLSCIFPSSGLSDFAPTLPPALSSLRAHICLFHICHNFAWLSDRTHLSLSAVTSHEPSWSSFSILVSYVEPRRRGSSRAFTTFYVYETKHIICTRAEFAFATVRFERSYKVMVL